MEFTAPPAVRRDWHDWQNVARLTGITNASSQFSDVSPPAVNGHFWRPARNLRCAAIGRTACKLLACV